MKILVTGGGGYLGSVLVPILLWNHEVTVLDLFLHGENSLAGCARDKGLSIINGDCRLISPSLLKAHDVIIPLAALVGADVCERDVFAAQSTNTTAIDVLTQLISRDQRLIYPMTNSGYGVGGEAGCDEDSPLNPVSHYGRTKVTGEILALGHQNTVSFRFATLFGASPRMRTDLMVNQFVLRALRDRYLGIFEPHFRRNFVHVFDAAIAILRAVEDHSMKGVYNCGNSSANMTKLQLAERIKAQIPSFHIHCAETMSDPDKRDYVVSNAKLEATGWAPQYSIDDGIAELIRLYQGLREKRYANA